MKGPHFNLFSCLLFTCVHTVQHIYKTNRRASEEIISEQMAILVGGEDIERAVLVGPCL